MHAGVAMNATSGAAPAAAIETMMKVTMIEAVAAAGVAAVTVGGAEAVIATTTNEAATTMTMLKAQGMARTVHSAAGETRR